MPLKRHRSHRRAEFDGTYSFVLSLIFCLLHCENSCLVTRHLVANVSFLRLGFIPYLNIVFIFFFYCLHISLKTTLYTRKYTKIIIFQCLKSLQSISVSNRTITSFLLVLLHILLLYSFKQLSTCSCHKLLEYHQIFLMSVNFTSRTHFNLKIVLKK